ncbi:hypothetical protein PAPYR_6913 [Paratrimastix pyriformis]|uniref:CUE domain-containing protein n=1 Tax=Paratrimastix pyriformis TaxID=342808 RepID=A0ABQ8UE66_9EUKA|nr:hypothetical protein PAPYR_6913 [Paratrimastix pyriformis]
MARLAFRANIIRGRNPVLAAKGWGNGELPMAAYPVGRCAATNPPGRPGTGDILSGGAVLMASNSVSLRHAMATLKTMFPTIDQDVLLAVLQEQNGYMERSIEILLEMSAQIPASAAPSQPQAAEPATPAVPDLPDDFLRLPESQPAPHPHRPRQPTPPAQARPTSSHSHVTPHTSSARSVDQSRLTPIGSDAGSHHHSRSRSRTPPPAPVVSPSLGATDSITTKAKSFLQGLFSKPKYSKMDGSAPESGSLLDDELAGATEMSIIPAPPPARPAERPRSAPSGTPPPTSTGSFVTPPQGPFAPTPLPAPPPAPTDVVTSSKPERPLISLDFDGAQLHRRAPEEDARTGRPAEEDTDDKKRL